MSHEGIRIVSEEAARKGAQSEQKLPADAVTPAKVRVKKSEGTGVEIDWKDGHKSSWSFRWLRDACPCATCHEEREAAGRKPGEPKPKAQSLLTLYEEPPRPVGATYARVMAGIPISIHRSFRCTTCRSARTSCLSADWRWPSGFWWTRRS